VDLTWVPGFGFEENLRALAFREAGHVVAHMLVGHPVLQSHLIAEPQAGGISMGGHTGVATINNGTLAMLVGICGGEPAIRRHLAAARPGGAAVIAAQMTSDDRREARRLTARTTLPVHVGELAAAELIGQHWASVVSVADALAAAPCNTLSAGQVAAAAGLGGTELSWEQLCEMTRGLHLEEPGVEEYLTGAGRLEHDRLRVFLEELSRSGRIDSPPTAGLRQLYPEVDRNGRAELVRAWVQAKARAASLEP
jgi:hypothetical protein